MKSFLALVGLIFATSLWGQQWPSKPVRVIVNVAPGGVADVTARVLGARLTETLGQPFVVENRAGGDGYIGFEAVGRADPDGYMMLYSPGSSMMIAPHIVSRADLDPTKLLTPVVPTGRVSLYVLTHPNVPVSNFKEFLAYARANPGKLNYGTPGNGTSPHIATEVFNREAKVKLNHVPYKGAGPALKDLLGGVIDLTFDPGVGLAQAKAGKLRMDELATEAGADPVEFRLRHLKDPRGRAVLEALQKDWISWRKAENRGHGVGFARYKNIGAYCAVLAEVEAGEVLRVKRLVVAADVGMAINPDGVANQLEGGAIQATSWTLKEEGRIGAASWEDYPILRFSEAPAVEVRLLTNELPSLGAGEAAQGPTAAAIANALHDALGVRVRDLPLTPERIVKAME